MALFTKDHMLQLMIAENFRSCTIVTVTRTRHSWELLPYWVHSFPDSPCSSPEFIEHLVELFPPESLVKMQFVSLLWTATDWLMLMVHLLAHTNRSPVSQDVSEHKDHFMSKWNIGGLFCYSFVYILS